MMSNIIVVIANSSKNLISFVFNLLQEYAQYDSQDYDLLLLIYVECITCLLHCINFFVLSKNVEINSNSNKQIHQIN